MYVKPMKDSESHGTRFWQTFAEFYDAYSRDECREPYDSSKAARIVATESHDADHQDTDKLYDT